MGEGRCVGREYLLGNGSGGCLIQAGKVWTRVMAAKEKRAMSYLEGHVVSSGLTATVWEKLSYIHFVKTSSSHSGCSSYLPQSSQVTPDGT